MDAASSLDSSPAARTVWLLTGVYFLSGACSLIDEVVWVRLLKLVLGNTVYAAAVVVAVFMGSLAVGALAMGRVADRVRRPLRLYAVIELLIAASALAVPWVLAGVDRSYVWLWRAWQPSPAGLLAVQVVASAAVVAVPSLLMGSTLPLLGAFVAGGGRPGHAVGRLYAMNTLGAAAGTFAAGFVLIRTVGVMGTLYVAAGLNVLVAVGGALLARTKGSNLAVPAMAKRAGSREIANSQSEILRWAILAAVFVSGLVSIGYEIIWMRSIVHLLKAETYVFSAVLTVYLLGNMIGAGFGSRLARRLTNPAAAFAVTLALLGAFGALYVPILAAWPGWLLGRLGPWLDAGYRAHPHAWTLGFPLLVGAILFAVPSVLMGLGFPLALQAWARHRHAAGGATGKVYGVNTIGAVVSGLATGFVLIPLAGVQWSITALGLLAVVAAGCLAAAAGRSEIRNSKSQTSTKSEDGKETVWARAFRACLLPFRICFGCCASDFGFRIWGLLLVLASVGAVLAAALAPRDLFRRRLVTYPDSALVDVVEGVTATASVHRMAGGDLWLCTSGMQIAGDRSMSVQRILGHLPVLLHRRPESVLTVGFGTGETTACLAAHDLQAIDCVEISPEVVELSLRHFRHINLGERLGERVAMHFMDAKNFLHLTDRRYDVIITDSINPKYFADNASLYTREYFATAAGRLNEGGIVACWVPFTLPPACFDSICGTFLEVFPHASLWFPTTATDHFVLLVGSMAPQKYPVRRMIDELARPAVAKSLAAIGIADVHDLLTCHIGDETGLRRYLSDYRLNSDLRPFVEFSTDPPLDDRAKWTFVMGVFEKVRAAPPVDHLDLAGLDEAERVGFLADVRLRGRITAHLMRAYDPADNFARGVGGASDEAADDLLAALTEYLARHDDFAAGFRIRGSILRRRGRYAAAVADYDRAVALGGESYEALHNRGFARFALGQIDEAIADYDRALALRPRAPATYNQRGLAFCRIERYARGIEDFDAAIGLDGDYADARFNRAEALSATGRFAEAVADYGRALRGTPDDAMAYAGRATALYQIGRYADALADVTKLQSLGAPVDPAFIEALQQQAR